MKNKYESVMILKESLENEEYTKEFDKIKSYFENCEIKKFEEIGKRKLAYEIKQNTFGIYILVEFQTEKENILEIERKYRIDENILKFIVVRIDD